MFTYFICIFRILFEFLKAYGSFEFFLSEITKMPLAPLCWARSTSSLARSVNRPEPLSLSLSLSLSSRSCPSPTSPRRSCRQRRRRLAPANSGRLRRRGVGQNTPLAPLFPLTGAIWALLPLVAARIPFALGLGFALAVCSSSPSCSPWLGAGLAPCAAMVWWWCVPLPPCAPSTGSASSASPPWSYGHGRLVSSTSPLLHHLDPLC